MSYSIIVPTWNRSDSLARTLASVLRLDFDPGAFEVIVVDNGSHDRTKETFEATRRMATRHNFKYLYEPMPGLLSARHRGASESEGEVCVFIDDDVRLGSNWLNGLRDAFTDPSVALVGGPSRPLFDVEPPPWLQDFYHENQSGRYCGWLSLFDGGEQVKEIEPRYIWGLNYAVRKRTLLNAGGFHPDCLPKPLQRYQGDGESGLSAKIRSAGGRCLYHPQAYVEHEVSKSRLTPRYFESRAYYQGVCDSYANIRKSGNLDPTGSQWNSSVTFAFDLLRTVKRGLIGPPMSLRDLTRFAYAKGYSFHQREVATDPTLLAWVLKETYSDYSLPSGWETYLRAIDR